MYVHHTFGLRLFFAQQNHFIFGLSRYLA